MRVFNPRKLRYAKVVDAVGKVMFRILGSKSYGERASLSQLAPRRILVLESHLIGDIVMAMPALRALRSRFQSSEITLVAGPWGKELLQSQGVVDAFVEIRFPWSTYDYSYSNLKKLLTVLLTLRKHQWDLGIDLRGDIRNIFFLYWTRATRRMSYNFTGGEYLLSDVIQSPPHLKHIVEYNAYLVEQLGCQVDSKEPALIVADNQSEHARRLLRSEGVTDEHVIIGIHPGASKPLRHWKAERFAELADLFLEDGKNRVLLFHGPADQEVVRRIGGMMKHTVIIIHQPLHQLPAIFRCCSLVIGLDSGAVHVAAAVGVPTVVLFGPAEPERVRPISEKTSVIVKDGYWCRPCDQVHCVQPLNNCMDAIDVKSVYLHGVHVLERNTREALQR